MPLWVIRVFPLLVPYKLKSKFNCVQFNCIHNKITLYIHNKMEVDEFYLKISESRFDHRYSRSFGKFHRGKLYHILYFQKFEVSRHSTAIIQWNLPQDLEYLRQNVDYPILCSSTTIFVSMDTCWLPSILNFTIILYFSFSCRKTTE